MGALRAADSYCGKPRAQVSIDRAHVQKGRFGQVGEPVRSIDKQQNLKGQERPPAENKTPIYSTASSNYLPTGWVIPLPVCLYLDSWQGRDILVTVACLVYRLSREGCGTEQGVGSLSPPLWTDGCFH